MVDAVGEITALRRRGVHVVFIGKNDVSRNMFVRIYLLSRTVSWVVRGGDLLLVVDKMAISLNICFGHLYTMGRSPGAPGRFNFCGITPECIIVAALLWPG
jgi:hypothetical protein